jgi:molybdate transport system substrate-binding protein
MARLAALTGLLAGLLLCAAAGCGSDEPPRRSITVFCGSANKPAIEEIAALYERERGVRVELIFGGSGTLLSQIELSGKGEIYIPGSPDYAVIARRKRQIVDEPDRVVAYLVPAIITPRGNPEHVARLEDLGRPGLRVGIGNPETVCLGLYAVELLERNGLLDTVLENVVTFGASCSKTANLAAMSQVDAILGWRVFHDWNPQRMDLVPIAGDQIPRISYIPITIPVHTTDRALSEDFVEFVLSERGKAIYRKLGYLTDLEQARRLAPHAAIGGEYALPPDYFERIKRRWQDK